MELKGLQRPTFFVIHANSRFAGQVDFYSFGEEKFINNPEFQKSWLNPSTDLKVFENNIKQSLENSANFRADSKTQNPLACTRSQLTVDPSFVKILTQDLKNNEELALSSTLTVPFIK